MVAILFLKTRIDFAGKIADRLQNKNRSLIDPENFQSDKSSDLEEKMTRERLRIAIMVAIFFFENEDRF